MSTLVRRLVEHYEGWRYRRTYGRYADHTCAAWTAEGREPQEVCPCGHYAASHSFDVCVRCFTATEAVADRVS